MNAGKKHLFIIYELEHLPVLEARIATGEQFDIVALDYEIELELKKRGIHFIPLLELAVSPEGNREVIEFTRRIALNWYTAPETDFFKHDGILLGEQHEGMILYYLQALVYFLSVIEQALTKLSSVASLSIPESFIPVPSTADPTAVFKGRLPVAVTRLLAERHGISMEIISTPLSYRTKGWWRTLKRRVFHSFSRVVVWTSNMLVGLLRKPRPIKLLVTNPWSRIEPFIKDMKDVELVMTFRKEMKVMGWNILRTRARFHHRLDFVDAKVRELAHARALEYARSWDALGVAPSISKQFEYKEISFWPVVKPLLDSLVKESSEDAVATIESAKKMFVQEKINCVLLFASTKGYNNMLAHIAQNMDIPSIELQHALEPVEASFVYARLIARYLAAYGNFTVRNYERFGVEPWRVVPCGSPRFDSYLQPVPKETVDALRLKLQLDVDYLNVLTVIPHVYLSFGNGCYTSYGVQGVMEAFARLHRENPSLRFLLRPRPGPDRKSFYNREETLGLFGPETRMTQFEDLRTLITLSDFVISGNSTVVLEAIILRRPVLMYVPKIIDKEFQEFEDAGAVLMARTEDELRTHTEFLIDKNNRDALVKRADDFLKHNFKFDNESAGRVAALIRRVAKKSI